MVSGVKAVDSSLTMSVDYIQRIQKEFETKVPLVLLPLVLGSTSRAIIFVRLDKVLS